MNRIWPLLADHGKHLPTVDEIPGARGSVGPTVIRGIKVERERRVVALDTCLDGGLCRIGRRERDQDLGLGGADDREIRHGPEGRERKQEQEKTHLKPHWITITDPAIAVDPRLTSEPVA